jgi:predicted AAA+ superfamily ATPase
LQRDLRQLAQVGDLAAFSRLVKLVALRNGGLLNYADRGRDAALPRTNVQRWLSILEASFLVTLLPPFTESKSKRLIKAPKLYFGDTGLGLHLADIDDSALLERSLGAGTWLEGLVLNELLAWRETMVKKPALYFRRSVTGAEVDFVIEHRRRVLPIEVKAARVVRVADARALDDFAAEQGSRVPVAVLLYTGSDSVQLTARTIAVPLGAVL